MNDRVHGISESVESRKRLASLLVHDFQLLHSNFHVQPDQFSIELFILVFSWALLRVMFSHILLQHHQSSG